VRGARSIAALAIAGAALSCGPRVSDYRKAVEEAWSLERKGQFEEAVAAAGKAAGLAEDPRDRDEALFLKARLLAEAERYDEARTIFVELRKSAVEESMRGRAIYELGLIALAEGNKGEARTYFLALIREYPDHGLCSVALKKTMVIVEETGGEPAVRSLLSGLLGDALESSFGDDVLWELAKLDKKAGRLAKAESWLLMIHKAYPYPKGGAAFEYLFLLAEVKEEQGKLEEAVAWLQTVADTTETSYVIGDYNDDAKAQALLKMGKLYFQKMNSPDKAYETFMKVVKLDWATRSDDGLWWAAQVRFAQNRGKEGCELLSKLVKKYDVSNFKRKSLKIIQGSQCAVQ
jgi:tetratricopeptide (TPR) repeat protein